MIARPLPGTGFKDRIRFRTENNQLVKDMGLSTNDSVYRERLFEHHLIWELMRHAWIHDGAGFEVSQPAIDRSGHDLVLEARGVMRHVQLKTSWTTGKTRSQNVHIGLGTKPSGCVIWIRADERTLGWASFLFFGGTPGMPLPSLEGLKVARHTKGNQDGEKHFRPNLREVPQSRFVTIDSVSALYDTLFGPAQPHGVLNAGSAQVLPGHEKKGTPLAAHAPTGPACVNSD